MTSLSQKRVLITGATGFVGANLAKRLVDIESEVIAIKRTSSNTWRINDILDKIRVVDIDLLDLDQLKNFVKELRPDIVFHLATYGNFSDQQDSSQILLTNINGTLNLITALLDSGLELLINTGSSSEYGIYDIPMSESLRPRPISSYGVTKSTATMLCHVYHYIYNLPVTTLRLFSPYGPFDHPSRLIPYTIMSCLGGKDMVFTGGDQERDYIFIDDVILAYIKAAEAPGILGKVINIGSGKGYEVRKIVNYINMIADRPVVTQWSALPYKKDEAFKWCADITLAGELLKWGPTTKIEDGLKKTYDWFKENARIYT